MKKLEFVLDKIIKSGIILYAVFAPFSISLSQIGIIPAIFFWIVKILLFKNARKIRGSFINIWVLILVLSMIISSFFAVDKIAALKGCRYLWQILILYLILNNTDLKFVKKLIFILLISTFILSLYGIYQHFYGWDIWKQKTLEPKGKYFVASGFFGLHLTFAGFILTVSFLAFGLLIEYFKKFHLFFMYLSMVLSIIFSYARSAWIGFIGGIVSTTFAKSKKFALFSVLIVLIFGMILYSFFPEIKIHMKKTVSFKWNKDRLSIWRIALEIIRDHPIFGIGNGNFKKLYKKYMRPDDRKPVGHPHNDFLNIYLTAGIGGFIAYIMIFYLFIRNIYKTYLSINNKEPFYKGILLGSIGSVISFLVAGLAQNYFTDSENGMLLWFVMGLALKIEQHFMKGSE